MYLDAKICVDTAEKEPSKVFFSPLFLQTDGRAWRPSRQMLGTPVSPSRNVPKKSAKPMRTHAKMPEVYAMKRKNTRGKASTAEYVQWDENLA